MCFHSSHMAPGATIILPLPHLHITLEKALKEVEEWSGCIRTIRTTKEPNMPSWSATWQWQLMGFTRQTLKCIQSVSSLSSFLVLLYFSGVAKKIKRNHLHIFTFPDTEDYWRWMKYSSLVLLWFSLWNQYVFCLTPQPSFVWWMLYQHKIWLTQLICKSRLSLSLQ